jgi:uncharacterized iron-regulated membrane protein
MRVRPTLIAIHLWVGLVAAPVLIVLGVTGALLVVEEPITDRLDRAIAVVTPSGPRRSVGEMLASVQRVYPGARLLGAQLGTDTNHVASLTVRLTPPAAVTTVLVDPYTARVLGTDAERHTIFQSVRQLHRQLLAGERGSLVVTWTSVALVLLAVTGPFVWWPRRRTGVRWSLRGWRLTLDTHALVGAFSWVFLLLLAVSGAVVHWDAATQRLLGTLTGKPAPRVPQPQVEATCNAQAMLSPDALFAAGSAILPGARPVAVQIPHPDSAVARLVFKYPEDHTPNGRSIVLMDECTGASLFVVSTRVAPVSYLYPREWNREIHTGDIFGWPTRVLAFLFALSLPAMAITGPLVWLMRRRSVAERRAIALDVRPQRKLSA